MIKLHTGDVPFEVIGDHDQAFSGQWMAIEKYAADLKVPGLRSQLHQPAGLGPNVRPVRGVVDRVDRCGYSARCNTIAPRRSDQDWGQHTSPSALALDP